MSTKSGSRTGRGDGKLSVRLREEIRQAILQGDYAQGQRLIEAELCERFGASRFMVRTVLQDLAGQGLVEFQHNRGARVRSITLDEAVEIMEVRRLLEGLVASRAAQRATPEQVRELQQIVEQMRAALAVADFMEYRAANTKLHENLRAIAAHSVTSELLYQLYGRTSRYGLTRSIIQGASRASLAQYAAIVDAVAKGDPELADAAARDHMDHLIAALRDSKGVSATSA